MTIITWRQTDLGVFYPTNDRDLIKKHGCTFKEADHPYVDSQEEAIKWAKERGYESKFDLTKKVVSVTSSILDMNDI